MWRQMLRFIHMILPAAQSLLNNKKLPVIAVVIKMISGQPRLPLIVLYREDHFRETGFIKVIFNILTPEQELVSQIMEKSIMFFRSITGINMSEAVLFFI